MQNLRLKGKKIKIKCSLDHFWQNSSIVLHRKDQVMYSPNLETWKKFNRLYFHAKAQIKSKKTKIKCSLDHFWQNSSIVLHRKDQVMYSPNLETLKKFNRLYFHEKSKIKSTKNHKIKFDTSLKSYGHFDNIYFHGKSQVKIRKYHKIKCHTSLKRYNHVEFKSVAWKQIR